MMSNISAALVAVSPDCKTLPTFLFQQFQSPSIHRLPGTGCGTFGEAQIDDLERRDPFHAGRSAYPIGWLH
jgi:hypothetical protein